MTEHVKITQSGGVMEICWNRPDKKNALSQAMYSAANDALLKASADPSVRCVVLSSEGDAFTAGNDIADFAKANAGSSDGPRDSSSYIRTIAAFDKPLVAGVPGLAIGVGMTMLFHCDLVFVAEDAKLSMPFVNLALVPEAASSITVPARVGYARAFAMFAMGEAVTGKQAEEWGIANKALPAAEAIPAARAAAERLAKQPLGAVMATKKLMREAERYAKQIDIEMECFGAQLKSAEAAEAFAAFAQKRKPDFTKVG